MMISKRHFLYVLSRVGSVNLRHTLNGQDSSMQLLFRASPLISSMC